MRFSHHLFVWLLEVQRLRTSRKVWFSHHSFVWLLEGKVVVSLVGNGSATIRLCGYWKIDFFIVNAD